MARWQRLGTRGSVEDRRGMRRPAVAAGGLGGVGLLIYLVISLLGGGQTIPGLDEAMGQLAGAQAPADAGGPQPPEFRGEDDYEVFVSTVLGSTDALWSETFAANGLEYPEPTVVLFRDATNSACGGATSAVGPHYCPLDETIYLDETFFEELTRRFGAEGGDVAEAYVIAHEVGHHVQKRLGIMEAVQSAQASASSRSEANELSVGLELQADCLAGVWAYSIRDDRVLEQGEIREAIDAAAAVGDDRIQEAVTGRVNSEAWTHGSSEQRVDWFLVGYETGDPAQCNSVG